MIKDIRIGAAQAKALYLGNNLVWEREFDPVQFFENNEQGLLYEPYIENFYQNTAGTLPVTASGDPIGLMLDKSGNGINALQSVSAKRPTYGTNPNRIVLDGVDDDLVLVVPTGGWRGTMVLATINGTSSYEVDIPAGDFVIGGKWYPTNGIVGVLLLNKSLSASDKAKAEQYFIIKGATASFSTVANFTSFWRTNDYITSFPLIDTSNGTIFNVTWYGCSLLVNFPAINLSNGDNFNLAWYACRALANFPAHMFDNVKGSNFTNAFGATNLSQTSIDGILTSLVTSGVASGTRSFGQSGGSEPSSIGRAAIDTLRSRGWTVTVTGGY